MLHCLTSYYNHFEFWSECLPWSVLDQVLRVLWCSGEHYRAIMALLFVWSLNSIMTKFPSGSAKIGPISRGKLLFIKIITPRLAFTPFFALKTRLYPHSAFAYEYMFLSICTSCKHAILYFFNECTGINLFFMPPTLKKWGGILLLAFLFVHSLRSFVHLLVMLSCS